MKNRGRTVNRRYLSEIKSLRLCFGFFVGEFVSQVLVLFDMDHAPLTTTPYAKRNRDGLGHKIRDHGEGPVKQRVDYYLRVGWSRTRRGEKTRRNVAWIGNYFITFRHGFTDPVTAFPEPADEMSPLKFRVQSQSGRGSYIVHWTGHSNTSTCSCPDYKWKQVCKHIRSVRLWRESQKESLVNKEDLEGELLDRTFEELTPEDLGNQAEELDRQGRILAFGGD